MDRPKDFREIGKRVSNWGRWGPDDERGTTNLLTPARVVEAASLIRRGKVFTLGIPFGSDGPQNNRSRTNPVRLMSQTGEGQAETASGRRYADDFVFMPLQAASQWDALAHVWYDGQLYNGFPESAVTPQGASRCSVENLAEGMVGRGVLLDVAGLRGVDWIEAGTVISPDELDAAATSHGVEIRPGDVLLIRTGWWRKFLQDRDAATWTTREPGLGIESAQWLRDKDVAALGMDNWGIEVKPTQDPEYLSTLHCVLLRDMGLPLGEMLDLEALAADCREDGVHEFFFSGPALQFTRALGSPVNPVAIK